MRAVFKVTRALKYAPARTFRSAAASLTPRQTKKLVRKSCAHILTAARQRVCLNVQIAIGVQVGGSGWCSRSWSRFLSLEKPLTFSSCVDVSDVVIVNSALLWSVCESTTPAGASVESATRGKRRLKKKSSGRIFNGRTVQPSRFCFLALTEPEGHLAKSKCTHDRVV